MSTIETIEREELKELLDQGADIKLVMTLHEWAFDAMHIPGSIQIDPRTVADELDVDEACVASQFAYRALVEQGYTDVRRYAGGLSDWHEAGYPLEGSSVTA